MKLKELKKKLMKNPEFKKEYNKLTKLKKNTVIGVPHPKSTLVKGVKAWAVYQTLRDINQSAIGAYGNEQMHIYFTEKQARYEKKNIIGMGEVIPVLITPIKKVVKK